MPFRLRLGKRSQQYNVANKDLFVIPIEIITNEPIECTLLATSIGRECLNNVCQRLNIQQSEYFGLLFKSRKGVQQWVDLSKPLKKQLDKYSLESRLYLRLQYFVPNLHFLSDEVSRYHYFCSMKLLVIEGRLHCDRDEAVLLASFSLQAEFGDFNPERHTAEYLNNFALFPRSMITNNKVAQDLHMECVINAYRKLQGVPPNVAEIYYISEAQQLDGIGQEGFPAKDNDTNQDVSLGVTLRGIFVVHTNSMRQEIFRWTDIANLIHQKKVFTIERNPDGLRKNYTTFDSDYASCIWRTCVEQHQYFMKGMRNSVDTDSQQSDQSKQEVPHLNNNINGANSMHPNQSNIATIINGAEMSTISVAKDSATSSASTSASALPQALQTLDLYNDNTDSQNQSADRFQLTREYSATNIRETTEPSVHHLNNTDHQNQLRSRSSTETTDLHQIRISFVDNPDIQMQQAMDGRSSISNLSNITTVQVHHQPSWATEQPRFETDLSYEQRRHLLPPYKSPPDYETFMRQKYGNLSVSVGNIGACIASCSSHPMANNYGRNGFVMSSASTSASSVRQFCPQQAYGQYANYGDLSTLEIDKTGLNKCGVRSSLPPTQNWLPSEHTLSSPLRVHQLTSGIITCSTPELNSLNMANIEKKVEEKCSHLDNNHHMLYLINNQRLPPPYGFNSVPDLSCAPIVHSQLVRQKIEPVVTLSSTRTHQTSGSEPNIANIPLMTAYSTPIQANGTPMPQPLNSSNLMQSSVDKLLQSHALHVPSVTQPMKVQNIYHLSQMSQRQHNSINTVNTNHNIAQSSEPLSPRILSQIAANSSQSISHTKEKRTSNGTDITSTIGSYLVNRNGENKMEVSVDSSKDRRVSALEESLSDPEFIREFDLLPRMNPTAKFTTALLPENIYRNRFRDILPYEDNRYSDFRSSLQCSATSCYPMFCSCAPFEVFSVIICLIERLGCA